MQTCGSRVYVKVVWDSYVRTKQLIVDVDFSIFEISLSSNVKLRNVVQLSIAKWYETYGGYES